jgi:hypothetical protein
MIDAVIKSSFLFKRKLITLPFIKVLIPIVAPTINTIINISEIVGIRISVENVILFINPSTIIEKVSLKENLLVLM